MTAKQVADIHLSINHALQDFLLDLEISNRTPRTIENYRSTIAEFAAYAGWEGLTDLSELTKSHLRRYLAYLKARPRWYGDKDGTQQLRAADSTYRWLRSLPIERPLDRQTILEIHRSMVTGCDADHCEPGSLRGSGHNVNFGTPRCRGADRDGRVAVVVTIR